MTDNILIANIYKQFIQFNIKNRQLQIRAEELTSHFSKKEKIPSNAVGEAEYLGEFLISEDNYCLSRHA